MSIPSTGLSKEERKLARSALRMKPLAVSVKTACELLGVGNTTMWQLIKEGRVQTIKLGRKRLVLYPSLEALTTDGKRGE